MSKVKGWLVVQTAVANARYTTAQRQAFTPPSSGFEVFDTDLGLPFWWDGTQWISGANAPVDSVNGQTGTVVLAGTDIAITPAGNLSAADVAAALNELQGKIDNLTALGAADYIAGDGDPTAADGENGNFYLNVTTGDVFGAKAGGAWPATPQNNVFANNFGVDPGTELGTAANGVSNLASREDHVHPMPAIGGLTDVDTDTTAPANGDVLTWDGTNWVPAESASASFQTSFTVASWTAGSPNTYLVPLATHGLPFDTDDVYDVSVYENDEEVIVCTKTLANGDVQVLTEGATFAGRIKISK